MDDNKLKPEEIIEEVEEKDDEAEEIEEIKVEEFEHGSRPLLETAETAADEFYNSYIAEIRK